MPDPPPMPEELLPGGEPPKADRGSLAHGFLVAAGWNAVAIGASVALLAVMIGIPLVAGFGLLQFAWLLPVWARFRRAGKTESARGVLITAGITILLSAGCWASLSHSVSQTSFH